tara:strand:+ start:6418 stop:7248 length:831 start_codon:yes stop_codon:yes gene_type:complete
MYSEKELIIEANHSYQQYWHDLWEYKRLFYFFTWRDIKVKYKQTAIGVIWSVIQPLLTMIVFILVFSKVAKLESVGGAPYSIMVLCGLLPWLLFSKSVAIGSESTFNNREMISRIYFPRMVIPISNVLVACVDFMIAFLVLLVIILFYGFIPSYKIIFIPLFFLMTFILATGICLFFSALVIKYHDFKVIVPFMLQMGIYITPVGFSSSIVPEYLKFWYSFNPMVGVVEGFRWAIIGGDVTIYIPGLIVSIVIILITLLLGIFTFRKMEKTFADDL